MAGTYRSSEFFRALPAQLRPRLPPTLRKFNVRLRNWMLQVYYADSYVHYEASAFPKLSCFEIALHFERRGRELNDSLMQHFLPYAFEIKADLGPHIEFERWDKGWSKIYETLPLVKYDEDFMQSVAVRMARMIACLEPMLSQQP